MRSERLALAVILVTILFLTPAFSVWPFEDKDAITAPATVKIYVDTKKIVDTSDDMLASSGLIWALEQLKEIEISPSGTFSKTITVPVEKDMSLYLYPEEPAELKISGTYSRGYLVGKFEFEYTIPPRKNWNHPVVYRASGDFYTKQPLTKYTGYGGIDGLMSKTWTEWEDSSAKKTVERTFDNYPVIAKWYKPSECDKVCGCGEDEYTGKGLLTKSHFDFLTNYVRVIHCGLPDPDEEGVPATLRTKLYVTDHIVTLEESSTEIVFDDQTKFKMGPNTEVILNYPPEQETKLGLVMGNVWINTKKILTGGSMEVEMGQAVAGIKGTTYVLEQGKDATSTLKVIEGVVNFTAKAGGKSVLVNGGEMVTASLKGGLGQVTKFDASEETAKWDKVSSGGPGIAIVISIVAIVALGAGVVFFLNKSKKKRERK